MKFQCMKKGPGRAGQLSQMPGVVTGRPLILLTAGRRKGSPAVRKPLGGGQLGRACVAQAPTAEEPGCMAGVAAALCN